jgi:hypothetical protein
MPDIEAAIVKIVTRRKRPMLFPMLCRRIDTKGARVPRRSCAGR